MPTLTSEVIVKMGEAPRDEDYSAKGLRTPEAFGLAGLDLEGLKTYLETGEFSVMRD